MNIRHTASDDSGFSLMELLVVAIIIGIVAAIAIPQGIAALRGYRLHSDSMAISSYVNLARMRSSSQNAPYRLVVNIAAGTYWIEKLCGMTPATTDAACTTPYSVFTIPQIEYATQYISQGNAFSSCRPGVVAASAFPGTILADPATCTDPFYMFFNTRGTPVDSAGLPLTNGGVALYITNSNNMVDAVTTSPGGLASTWTCPLNCVNFSLR